MGKQSAPRRVGDKEALAVNTSVRGSAQKLNLVAALIRGRKVEDALNILQFSTKAMAVDVRKVLASAIANAEKTAAQFAKNSKSQLNKIVSADQGQFSIEDRDQSTPYIKKVRVVTTIVYSLKD